MNLEKDLLVRLINADENAFKEIFDHYFQKVNQFVYSYIKEATQAEDITQNIFIRLWEKKAGIDVSKSFDGYIFTIAYRMVIDYFRQTQTKLQYSATDDFFKESIASPISSDELLNRHQLESLMKKPCKHYPLKERKYFY